jgi:hypothetical protein
MGPGLENLVDQKDGGQMASLSSIGSGERVLVFISVVLIQHIDQTNWYY